MINKRLVSSVPRARAFVAWNVAFQWLALVMSIVAFTSVSRLVDALAAGRGVSAAPYLAVTAAAALAGIVFLFVSSRMGAASSREVKTEFRRRIYGKLLRIGGSYDRSVATGEAVQMATNGVDQLEAYFAGYLPQMFYAMLASLTVFAYMATFSMTAAIVLLVGVPLIPLIIAVVQTFAKRIVAKYWNRYTSLGDSFLENVQGMTTLKVYGADEARHRRMNREAEEFRSATMHMLTMQLNSIAVMDLVAYLGAALGMAIAVSQAASGRIGTGDATLVILLSADYFLPMRRLGSYFHVAMNGSTTADRIFAILDAPEAERGNGAVPDAPARVEASALGFSYPAREDGEAPVAALSGVDLDIPAGSFTALVGESGSGKSTLARILSGRLGGYDGSVRLCGAELRTLDEGALMGAVTYVGHDSVLCPGTVRDNLAMGAPRADDDALWRALRAVRLDDDMRARQGLDTPVGDGGEALSGGQRQRLALARALLHDTPVYIFDEPTSNVDPDSEAAIMDSIRSLRGSHTVIIISHRLATVTDCDRIIVLDGGAVVERGDHDTLVHAGGRYEAMWDAQSSLERFTARTGARQEDSRQEDAR